MAKRQISPRLTSNDGQGGNGKAAGTLLTDSRRAMRLAETTKPSLGGLCFFHSLALASGRKKYRANEVYGVGILPVGHFVSPVTGE
jgi:hypothetical protein